jgi:hypothetical protein
MSRGKEDEIDEMKIDVGIVSIKGDINDWVVVKIKLI